MPDYPDVFTQFRTIKFTHHASDHTVLTEAYIETGLETRGGLGWVIHQVELQWCKKHIGANLIARFALSTRRNLSTLPALGDKGCVAVEGTENILTTSGYQAVPLVDHIPFRPPLLLAARYLALYFQTDTDNAGFDSKTSYARVHFTTRKLIPTDYIEIAETWGE